jgi:hypothetical protein
VPDQNKDQGQKVPPERPRRPLLFGPDGEAYYGSEKEEHPQETNAVALHRRWYRKARSKDAEFWQAVAAWAIVVVSVPTVYLARASLTETANQVAIMQEQLSASMEFFRIGEQAWIELEPIKPALFHSGGNGFGKLFQYDAYIKNVGKTPAREITMKAITPFSGTSLGDDAGNLQRTQNMLNRGIHGGDHLSNRIPKVLAPGSTSPVPLRLTGQEPQYLDSGALYSYLIGRIDYEDAFSIKHWKTFCFFVVNARGELWQCKEGNNSGQDADPSQPAMSEPRRLW